MLKSVLISQIKDTTMSEYKEPILQFFDYDQLTPELQTIAKPFYQLAYAIVLGDNSSESGNITIGTALPKNYCRSAALYKLLAAKDSAIRAVSYKE
jgi:hypothetical protein